MLYLSSKAQIFTLVESSWFAIKDFGSCVVYFGLWLGATLCFGRFLVVLGTYPPCLHSQGIKFFDTESSHLNLGLPFYLLTSGWENIIYMPGI